MRFFASIIGIALLAYVLGMYFPWWTIAIAGFFVSFLLPQRPATSFLTGFLAVFLLWTIIAALINTANGGILAGRIGLLMGVGKSPVFMTLLTGITGGLVTGFAALSASWLRPVRN